MAIIEFGSKTYLVMGIIFLVLFFLFFYFKARKIKYESTKISTSSILSKTIKNKSKKDKILTYLMISSIFLLFFALSDPMMRLKGENEGVNIIMTIDNSGSMQAQDFSPNRMESAKESAKLLLDELETKDKVGIITFSDSTRIVSFLTNDKSKAEEKIDGIVANGGTAIGDGLALSVDMVTSIPNKKKLIVLLSDGEQTAGQISIDDAIKFAKANEVVVYTIGVGSTEDVVLGYDWFGRPQYARLDEVSLKKIAEETGGEYFRAVDEISLENIYENLPDIIKKEKELQSIKDEILILTLIIMISSLVYKFWRKTKLW